MIKTVCIMCGNERDGLVVKDDAIIGALRWIKTNITRNAKNYRLVVCKECFLNYRKKRESYERKMIIYTIIGIIFLVSLAVVSNEKLSAVGVGLLIIILLLLLAQLSYVPAVSMPKARAESKPKRRTRRRA
jgi:hypothetical protein